MNKKKFANKKKFVLYLCFISSLVPMTPISSSSATGILTAVGDVATFVITSLVNLAPVFLSVAGIGIVLGMLYRATSRIHK